MSTSAGTPTPLRVLVVDDSAYNRQTITAMLEANSGVHVVGRAVDGKEALQKAFELEPDLITLDLEMPEMDGFAFLRLLMARRPTPVLIISGYAARENVFRALDLGALDFIAKPGRQISPELKVIEDELRSKIGLVRRLQSVRLKQRADSVAQQRRVTQSIKLARETTGTREPITGASAQRIVVVGSSTGGPPTVQQLLRGLPTELGAAVIIAQHMPARFTRAFANRLNRVVDLRVVEAEVGQPVVENVVYVIPGGYNLSFGDEGGRASVKLEVVERSKKGVALAPSADHLFTEAARVWGDRSCAIVLTGMGNDGSVGASAVKRAGGRVYAEDPNRAVMPGMPQAVIDAGVVDRVLPVENLHKMVKDFVGIPIDS